MTVGRYAPSPSGRMHLGNLCCCLLAWLSAKSKGGRVVLRIEDLDTARCPRKFAELLQQDLAWLGLSADEGGDAGLDLAHVAIAVVGLDLHIRNTRTLDGLLHARALNVEGVAGL